MNYRELLALRSENPTIPALNLENYVLTGEVTGTRELSEDIVRYLFANNGIVGILGTPEALPVIPGCNPVKLAETDDCLYVAYIRSEYFLASSVSQISILLRTQGTPISNIDDYLTQHGSQCDTIRKAIFQAIANAMSDVCPMTLDRFSESADVILLLSKSFGDHDEEVFTATVVTNTKENYNYVLNDTKVDPVKRNPIIAFEVGTLQFLTNKYPMPEPVVTVTTQRELTKRSPPFS